MREGSVNIESKGFSVNERAMLNKSNVVKGNFVKEC